MVTYVLGRITGYGHLCLRRITGYRHLCLREDNRLWTPMFEGGQPAMVTYV